VSDSAPDDGLDRADDALSRDPAPGLDRASAEERLREAEAKYRTLVEQLPLVTYIDALTASASSLYVSPQVESLLGYTVEEWLTDPEFFPKLLHPEDYDRIMELVDHCNNSGERFNADYRLIARDGRTVWVQDESLIVHDEDGRPLFTQGYLLDITARKEAEQRLVAEHGVARVLAESTTLDTATPKIVEVVCDGLGWELGALWLFDREAGLLKCRGVYDSSPDELGPLARSDGERLELGTELASRIWRLRAPLFVSEMRGSKGVAGYAVPVVLDAVVLGVLEFRSRGMREPDENVAGTVAVIASQLAQFIDRKQTEEAIYHQALHDGLTGLPNRTLFHDRVSQAIEMARRSEESLAVMLMDLDRFKEVNDTLGHHSGDVLLNEIGKRLQDSVRSCDTVARLGGDEFGFVLTNVDAEQARALMERIRRALARPCRLQDLSLQVEGSIGIALFPQDGSSVDQLLQRADVAMYVAKRGGHGHAFYDADKDHHTPTRLTMVGELRRAIEQRELVLYYQPQVELDSGRVFGVEALLRWEHPTRGLLAPDAFLPTAERTGLMDSLTRYVIEHALRQRQQWFRAGHELTVAVNISMRNLLDSGFPADVEALLVKWGAPASCLELEITEHTAVGDRLRAESVLAQLGQRGLRVAVDDFGTGYSSLAYLRRLPLHEIKIDRSFVSKMTSDRDDAVIVRSTIDLARNLGLQVVAEGVETAEICDALVELGCDSAQGYYWSRPLPADALTAWLEQRARGGPAARDNAA
jgi:diguanylate cyclase (GGDEF)-like protein/PAS domain S-box-containing protein